MDRRKFLQSMAMAGGVILPVSRHAWALAGNAGTLTKRKLIVVMLRGAVDGLSVVAPFGDADYAQSRPTIALGRPGQDNGAIDLDGYFGLHPALLPLLPLWQEKKLAFVHACGSPDPTRSHFDAQDFLESGTPGMKGTQDGWLNRLLTVLPGPSTPTRAVSIGPVMPRILSGRATATNLAAGAAGTRPNLLDRPQISKAFDQLYQGSDRFRRAYQDARDAHQEIMMAATDSEMLAANGGAPLPNGLPADAASLAMLMRNDPNIQLAFIALGGWDTHANQGAASGQLANRLAPLGQGLATLAQRLGPMLEDTVIVVMSEFGRTVRQNGNGGTDHGHGNVMWVMGGDVSGGKVYGDWKGLASSQLYEGRDLPVTTDFRSVLAAIAERHLRLNDKQLNLVFSGWPAAAPRLPLMHA